MAMHRESFWTVSEPISGVPIVLEIISCTMARLECSIVFFGCPTRSHGWAFGGADGVAQMCFLIDDHCLIEISWVSDQGVRTCWLCLHFCQSIVFESRISFFIVMAPKRRSARKGSKKAAKKGGARGGDGFVG